MKSPRGVQPTASSGGGGGAIVARSASAQVDPGRWHAGLATAANKWSLAAHVIWGSHPDAVTSAVVQVARLARAEGTKHSVISTSIRIIAMV